MKPTIVIEKVTLEAIGRLIERSVAKLATKEEMSKLATKEDISKIDDRLSLVDNRFDAVDGKLLEFTKRFDAIEFKIERMDTRFTNQLDYFNLYYPTRNEFTELDARMKKVERKLKT